VIRIAHISDLHVGSIHFVPNLMNRVINELNEMNPDLVVCTGDFTNEGFRQEYKTAGAYIQQIRAPFHAVPGNHDARNVGYSHFEELIGPRHWITEVPGVRLVGVDSSEPDLDHGRIGRERYGWVMESFEDGPVCKALVMHHHLLPVPGTGRERNIVYDAGDLLEVLVRSGVNLVLTGHKHVPWVWRLENIYVVNAGTCASLRLRGNTKPCYNVFEIDQDEVKIHRKFPFGGSNVIAHFSLTSGAQYYREIETSALSPETLI